MRATLAKDGGPKTRTAPWPKVGPRFGDEELAMLKEALGQNTLFYTLGKMTDRLLDRMKTITGAPYAVACSSGSAAIHGAVKAAGVGPGDDVVAAPITDAGGLVGIVYEGARPVFADVDPETWSVTPATIEAALTPKTRAVLVVHLIGNPVDIEAVADLCRRRGVVLIEDCAHAFFGTAAGRPVGGWGDYAIASMTKFFPALFVIIPYCVIINLISDKVLYIVNN